METGLNSSKYRSTRGHKLNHSFSRLNSRYAFYDSARFGIVSAIETKNYLIPQGEELFVHYRYSYDKSPLWYKDLFNDFLQQNHHVRNKTFDNLIEDIPYSSMSNFTQTMVLNQHELLNKVMSSLEITSTKQLDILTLNNILVKHMLYYVYQ